MAEMMRYLSNHTTAQKLLISGILIIINILVVQSTSKILFKTVKNSGTYYNLRKRFSFTFTLILIVLILLVWSESKLDLTTYMGFISAGIAIALREIFTNIAAWFIIVFQKPFEVGDRIHVNGQTGDIIDIKLFQIILLEVSSIDFGEQSTGRIVQIPNNFIFIHSITNANKGFDYIWNEIEVRLTMDSDWEVAKQILNEIINKHALHLTNEVKESIYEASKKYMLYYRNLTPIVYVNVKDGYIALDVRYLCETRKARVTENDIWQAILIAFKENDQIKMYQ
ncbi:mechanosensitive ion channel domain-containing protein [Fusibacter bizertensis]